MKISNFAFVDNPQDFNEENAFVAHLGIVSGKKELLSALNSSLNLPYFGWNWDALNDCLSDLGWISEHNIIVVHDGMPRLSNKELLNYADILDSAIMSWIGDPRHTLKVVFPSSSKRYFESISAK